MELDVDVLIGIFEKYSSPKNKMEMGEQDAAAPGAGGTPSGGGKTSNVPKWADLYTIKRGKGNMLGKSGEKWETGLTRGLGNQIW